MKIYYIRQYDYDCDRVLHAYTDKKYALRVLRRLYSFLNTYATSHKDDYYKFGYDKTDYVFFPKWRNNKIKNEFYSIAGTFCIEELSVKEVKRSK